MGRHASRKNEEVAIVVTRMKCGTLTRWQTPTKRQTRIRMQRDADTVVCMQKETNASPGGQEERGLAAQKYRTVGVGTKPLYNLVTQGTPWLRVEPTNQTKRRGWGLPFSPLVCLADWSRFGVGGRALGLVFVLV